MAYLYRKFGKRLLDIIIAVPAFILLSPVFLLTTALLCIANRGSVFFFQRRPGLNGRIFMLVKFRTMHNGKDASGKLLPDEKRLTALGKFIRKTSLDEIPQLLNVIMGDMSLVGPRPLLVDYLPLYSLVQRRRHDVKPGITGWAQVNGRNSVGWEKKFEMDVWYVDHVSLTLDIRILVLTIKKVFKSEGISQQGHATMPAFKGSNHS